MGLETGVTYIDDLDETWPLGSDDPDTLDNHDRNIKTAVKGSLPNLGAAAVTKTAAEINDLATVTGTETLTNKTLSGGAITAETALTTTSGTTKDFTIPSWAKKITVMFDGVSVSATPNYIGVQLGTSSTPEATGYTVDVNTTLVSQAFYGPVTYATQFAVSKDTLPIAGTITGQLVLKNITGNVWIGSGMTIDSTTNDMNYIVGRKETSGTLDIVRILVNTGAFDAGSVNVTYEG